MISLASRTSFDVRRPSLSCLPSEDWRRLPMNRSLYIRVNRSNKSWRSVVWLRFRYLVFPQKKAPFLRKSLNSESISSNFSSSMRASILHLTCSWDCSNISLTHGSIVVRWVSEPSVTKWNTSLVQYYSSIGCDCSFSSSTCLRNDSSRISILLEVLDVWSRCLRSGIRVCSSSRSCTVKCNASSSTSKASFLLILSQAMTRSFRDSLSPLMDSNRSRSKVRHSCKQMNNCP